LLPALIESDVTSSFSAIHDLCNLYAIQHHKLNYSDELKHGTYIIFGTRSSTVTKPAEAVIFINMTVVSYKESDKV